MSLLETTSYPAVRAAIDVTLDANNLPDATIGLTIYKGRAEAWVAARTSDTGAHAIAAAIYYCAWLLFDAVPRLTSEQIVGGGYQRQYTDPVHAKAALLAHAEQEIIEITATTDAALMPPFFTVAPGYRGQ
jgi:hypothetical protein